MVAGVRTGLINARKRQGYTQESLAQALRVETSTVGRWERGSQDPQPWMRRPLANLLQISLDELAELLVARRVHVHGDLSSEKANGRVFTRMEASDEQMLVDAHRHYERMYRTSGGLPVKIRLERFLNENVNPLLVGSNQGEAGRRIMRAAGSLNALAGVCAYDCEHYGAAQRHFDRALNLADSSGESRFGGYIYALMANQSLALKDFRQAVDHVEAAIGYTNGNASAALMADLYVMQSKAYAQMVERQLAYSAIARAESFVDRIRSDKEPSETGYVQPGLIEAKLGEALISLGDLNPAREYAEKSLTVDAHPRGRVNRLASMVGLKLKGGDVEQASSLAVEMVERAEGMESRRLHSRFRELRVALNRGRAKAAAEAVDRLDRSLRIHPW